MIATSGFLTGEEGKGGEKSEKDVREGGEEVGEGQRTGGIEGKGYRERCQGKGREGEEKTGRRGGGGRERKASKNIPLRQFLPTPLKQIILNLFWLPSLSSAIETSKCMNHKSDSDKQYLLIVITERDQSIFPQSSTGNGEYEYQLLCKAEHRNMLLYFSLTVGDRLSTICCENK